MSFTRRANSGHSRQFSHREYSHIRLAERHLESRCPLCVLPLTPTHRRIRLEWRCARGNCTAAEGNQVVLSDESRLNLSRDDKRVCVWRPHGERLNPAFALQRHTAPAAGVIV
ncbi:transposable element Tcb2 transposase [Trichonephila clavipes]|nr:transposable element Tcb2 transposase [Trichonephila clavipes]